MSVDDPCSMMRPAYMMLMRSTYRATTPRLWVMRSRAMSRSRVRVCIRSRIWAWMVTSRDVVGSSAMMRSGSQLSAMAIITRCLMPPENSCGNCASRRSGSEMPTVSRSSSARSLACRFVRPSWVIMPSVSWVSMLMTGLSDDIGSWKTMAMRRLRYRRMSDGGSWMRSVPRNLTSPSTMRPGGDGY